MIPTRESGAERPNPGLDPRPPEDGEGNAAWLARTGMSDGIVLLGGSSLADVRLRFAQSALRSDLTPSYWSTCGILDGGRLLTVPFEVADVSDVPGRNAVHELPLDAVDDPERWPNVAVLRFTTTPVLAWAERVRDRRTVVDLPRLLVAWLGWVWAADDGCDPLSRGIGMPSAAFVSATYSLAGIELTPGLSSTASCPEAIWQAVKWWHDFYAATAELGTQGDAAPMVPEGVYGLRQTSASVRLRKDAPLFMPPPGGTGPGGSAPGGAS
jgi:hypothetical protein